MATVRERGQLVLIAGLALAISLVAIALVLNSAIYTHNLASRYDSPGDGVVRSNHDVRESAGANVRYANEEFAADGYDSIRSNYTDGIADIEAAIAEDAAIHGRLIQVSHVDGSDVEGVRIVDDEAGGSNFTSRTNESNWTVVKDAQVRGFVIRADADPPETSSLTEGTVLGGVLGSDAFTVGFDDTGDGSDNWRVAIYENDNSGEINATVRNIDTGDTWTCNTDGPEVDIDFSSGRIGSESCAPLLFVDDLSKPYDISFNNSDQISGSYRMVADGVVDGPDVTTGAFTDRVDTANYGAHCGNVSGDPKQTFYNASANTSEYPRVTPALYEAAVNTTYDSDSVTYEGRHRIAMGETGGPPQTPVIRLFDVSDSGDGNFTVDWDVTDPNGASPTVNIVAEDDNGSTTSMNAGGTTGTDELFDFDTGNGPYTFNITATDGTNSRGAVQTHTDDGNDDGCPA